MAKAPKFEWLEKAITRFSPERAARRAYFRSALEASHSGGATRLDRGWSTPDTSYVGGRLDERTRVSSGRDRAKQLVSDNPVAAAMIDRATENVIGVEIGMRAATDVPAFNEQVDKLYAKWKLECDLTGWRSFGGIQQAMYGQKLTDGDVGCILVDKGGKPRLQLIEADRISTPDEKIGDRNFIEGVEVNAVGRPIRFHIFTGDQWGKRTWEPIDADNFIFLPRLRRSNQIRGITAFAQGFRLFDHLDAYVEGSVIAARAAANQALLIKKNNASSVFGGLGTAKNGNSVEQKIQRMEPGMVHYLNPDEDVVQMNPAHPTQQFPDFVAALSRFVGLNFGLTLEQVMLDFSRANYSSARAARLQADATAYVEQQHFYELFLSRVWRWLVSKWIKSGVITGEIPEDAWAHEWIPQGKGWVDPTKEIDSAIREVKELGISSPSYWASERGYDFRKVCQQRREDEETLKEFDLPSLAAESGTTPEAEPEAPDEPEDETPDDKTTKDTDDEDQ